MPAIEQSEIRRLMDLGDLPGLRELLCGEPANVDVPWPTEPGLWRLNYPGQSGPVRCWVVTEGYSVGPLKVIGWNGWPVIQRESGPLRSFTGPLDYIEPEIREPGPWDYQPQEGDWVWQLSCDGKVSTRPMKFREENRGYARRNGHRFAFAGRFEPPEAPQ